MIKLANTEQGCKIKLLILKGTFSDLLTYKRLFLKSGIASAGLQILLPNIPTAPQVQFPLKAT